MALRPKSESVKFPEFTTELCHILSTLVEIDKRTDLEKPEHLVITSANDSKHKPDSKHYKNQAIDLRSKSFKTEADKADFMAALAKALGPRYTVIYEYPGQVNEHFHIQLKRGL